MALSGALAPLTAISLLVANWSCGLPGKRRIVPIWIPAPGHDHTRGRTHEQPESNFRVASPRVETGWRCSQHYESFRTQNGNDIESGDATTGGPDTSRRDESEEQSESSGRSRVNWLRPIDQAFEKAPRKMCPNYSGDRTGYDDQQSLPQ